MWQAKTRTGKQLRVYEKWHRPFVGASQPLKLEHTAGAVAFILLMVTPRIHKRMAAASGISNEGIIGIKIQCFFRVRGLSILYFKKL